MMTAPRAMKPFFLTVNLLSIFSIGFNIVPPIIADLILNGCRFFMLGSRLGFIFLRGKAAVLRQVIVFPEIAGNGRCFVLKTALVTAGRETRPIR